MHKKRWKKKYTENGFKFLISNDYDWIIRHINYFVEGVRIPCIYCSNQFWSKEKYKTHLKSFHKK